jgi:predicted phosphohydrolase
MKGRKRKLYAISDLHLPLANDIRLTKFGAHWEQHEEVLARKWDEVIDADDIVLVPGDISWAQTANRAKPDMEWLGQRTGEMYVSQGNHDRWWRSRKRLKEILPENAHSVHDAWQPFFGGWIAATVGMTSPKDEFFGSYEKKKWPKALKRVESLMDDLAELRRKRPVPFVILLMHYPPCSGDGEASEIAGLIEESPVDLCLYGHFHRKEEWENAWQHTRGGTSWRFVAGDALGFEPTLIGMLDDEELIVEPDVKPEYPTVRKVARDELSRTNSSEESESATSNTTETTRS